MRFRSVALASILSFTSILLACTAAQSLSEIRGQLELGDSVGISGKFYDAYAFKGRTNQFVTLKVERSEFDIYLSLQDENYQILDEDASIAATLPREGLYRVVVFTAEDDPLTQGEYVLSSSIALTPIEPQLDQRHQAQAGVTIFFIGVGVAVAMGILRTFLEIYKLRATKPDRVVFSYKDAEKMVEIYTADRQRSQKIKVGKTD